MKKRCLMIFILLVNCLCLYSLSFFVNKLKNEIVILKDYITIGYNTVYKIPNYVGEKLVYSMTVGSEKREPGFYPETLLPVLYLTKSKQYTNTGYDRGHLAPAADFKWNKNAMYDSFSMANVAPLWPDVNRNSWMRLEKLVRGYSEYVDTLYIITGTVVEEPYLCIPGDIVIPKYFYKAILGKFKNRYVISCAWLYNNDSSKKSRRMTINALEEIIGRNLFYKKNNETVEGKILVPTN